MNIDDPKLTAYALGELTGEERRAVESEIANDPQLRAFVEDTRAFAGVLSREFHAEMPTAELASEQRMEVVDHAVAKEKMVRLAPRHIDWTAGLAWGAGIAAAAALVMVAAHWTLFQTAVPPADFTGGGESLPLVQVPAVQPAESSLRPIPPIAAATPASAPAAQAEPVTPVVAMNAPVTAARAMADKDTRVVGQVAKRELTLEQQQKVKHFTSWSSKGSAGIGVDSRQALEAIRIDNSSAPVFVPPVISNIPPTAAAKALRQADPNTESYASYVENPFREVAQEPLSTFSIDVDTASYSNVRRFLSSGRRPPVDAVRIEELINYFHYDYPQPKGEDPFSVNVETAPCPWEPQHRLVRIGLKGREIENAKRPASNLVFLIDVSGSMDEANKLPLLKSSMCQMVEQLGENDKVSIVVYAGSTGIALTPTRGNRKEVILKALDKLKAGGSTNGSGGIQLAYQAAVENLIPEGTNRVILATDGDFNVGTTSDSELVRLIEEKRKSGVYLTVLGFGEGNLNDSMMKKLASHGNGNYAYIDSLREGRKVLVKQLGGTLVTIAKDVKIQVEFNPRVVGSYRLVGYESRMLAKEDFNNDKKDAGEIGAGHTVTALYEVVPAGQKGPGSVDPLKYQPEKPVTPPPAVEGAASKEMLTVKLRYKKPSEEQSRLIEQPVADRAGSIDQSSPDFRFAAAVAEFGMLLRNSNQGGSANWEQVYQLAAGAEGSDEGGYRAEFLELVRKARGGL